MTQSGWVDLLQWPMPPASSRLDPEKVSLEASPAHFQFQTSPSPKKGLPESWKGCCRCYTRIPATRGDSCHRCEPRRLQSGSRPAGTTNETYRCKEGRVRLRPVREGCGGSMIADSAAW